MNYLTISSAALVVLALQMHSVAYAAPAECAATLPAGITIRVSPDEKLTAGVTTGPTILTVTSDVRFFRIVLRCWRADRKFWGILLNRSRQAIFMERHARASL